MEPDIEKLRNRKEGRPFWPRLGSGHEKSSLNVDNMIDNKGNTEDISSSGPDVQSQSTAIMDLRKTEVLTALAEMRATLAEARKGDLNYTAMVRSYNVLAAESRQPLLPYPSTHPQAIVLEPFAYLRILSGPGEILIPSHGADLTQLKDQELRDLLRLLDDLPAKKGLLSLQRRTLEELARRLHCSQSNGSD